MDKIIFDIEADSLKPTKIHCLSYCIVGEFKIYTLYNYNEIVEFFNRDAIFIGHFISGFDLPAIGRILNIDFTHKTFYDTLFLSSYIMPGRKKYGLEDFGQDYGVQKVKVKKDEWLGDVHTDEAFKTFMTSRCETDVKINTNLWVNIENRMKKLYDGEEEIKDKLYKYFAFKAKCAYVQQVNPILIDYEAGLDLLAKLSLIKKEKEDQLAKVMPKNPKWAIKEMPKIMKKLDGTDSANAIKWFQFLESLKVPKDNVKPVKYVAKWEDPNPQSYVQIKNWLFSLGWEPCTFRYERNKETNEVKKVPQILNEDKELTYSVEVLLEKVPELELLAGLGVVRHRISLLEGKETKEEEDRKGILHSLDSNGYMPQTLKTVTSTLRFKHGGIVNIPSLQKPYGKELRSLFIAPKGKVIIGCDVKNLESRTRDHCIYPLDPDYVEEMSQPGYDNHLDIAVFAGLLTPEQAQAHKDGTADYSKERKIAKQLNFAAIYGVGANTLSRNTGLSVSTCERLLEGFWKRNWSIRTYANSLKEKKVLGSRWIKSEVSGFWLELRSDNDKFSAHNQNMGAYYFDTWLSYVVHFGIIVPYESHDELFFYCDEDKADEAVKLLHKCAKLANKKLNLNVTIEVDAKVGKNYSETH